MVSCLLSLAMQLLTTVLDWCFPPRDSERTIRSLTLETLPVVPKYPAPNTTCLLPYQTPQTLALIHEAKYHFNQRAHQLLGQLTAQYLAERIPDAILVPVPLHPHRERERGFNQVTASLATVPRLRSQLSTKLLIRTRHTQPQTRLSAAARAHNVKDAFVVPAHPSNRPLPYQPIVLIDDVYTTGATMNAAYTTVHAAFPHHRIYCLTFAYA